MNLFKQGSAHDQQCAIFEFVGNWERFKLYPDTCKDKHGKLAEEMLIDLMDAYFGECMAVQRMIVQALCLLLIFEDLEIKIINQFVNRVKSDKKYSTYKNFKLATFFPMAKCQNPCRNQILSRDLREW